MLRNIYNNQAVLQWQWTKTTFPLFKKLFCVLSFQNYIFHLCRSPRDRWRAERLHTPRWETLNITWSAAEHLAVQTSRLKSFFSPKEKLQNTHSCDVSLVTWSPVMIFSDTIEAASPLRRIQRDIQWKCRWWNSSIRVKGQRLFQASTLSSFLSKAFQRCLFTLTTKRFSVSIWARH